MSHPTINAHQARGLADIDMLSDFIKNKSVKERSLILCVESVSRSTMISLLAKGIQTCIFVSDMKEGGPLVVSEELEKFQRNRIAVCSFDAFRQIELPVVENYVFFGFPAKITHLPKALDALEKLNENKNSSIRIDFIVSMMENPNKLRALHMEIKNRKCVDPLWLAEFVIKTFAELECQDSLLAEERKKRDINFMQYRETLSQTTSDTSSGSPLTSFMNNSSPVPFQKPSTSSKVVEITNRQREPFDIYNMKPNAEGKYVIPSYMVENHDYDDAEPYNDEELSCDDDYDYERSYEENEMEYDC